MEWRRLAGTYDCRNRLIQAGDTRYTYDAENNRIGVETDRSIIRYLVDSQQELTRILQTVETDKTTGESQTTYYTYGKGLISQEEAATGYRLYHFNHLGSTTLITDESGQVMETFEYNPYGELLDGEIGAYPFLFNGEYGVVTDANGLYYMRARYYNVDIKRFMNQDVIVGSVENSPSLNRYAYVEGNPVNYLDPFGLEKWESPYKLEHELMRDFNNALIKLNLHVAILTMIFPEISGLTIPLLMFSNVFGIVFSAYDVVFYIADLLDPENQNPEDRKLVWEEMGWSLLSIALCCVPIKDFYYSLMYNFKDPLLEFIKEIYYEIENLRLNNKIYVR